MYPDQRALTVHENHVEQRSQLADAKWPSSVLCRTNPNNSQNKRYRALCHPQGRVVTHARSDESRQAIHGINLKVADPPLQCDDIKPTCQRCTKSRRVCLWTSAKEACFLIHFENRYASGETKRPRGPRSTSTAASSGIVSAVLQRPHFDLQTRALIHYLHRHLQTLTDMPSILKGLPDFVPAWISRTKCPMVDLAISSMALAVYSRTQQHPPAATDASIKYQQLLRIVQVTIPTLDERNIDACLLAIFFMSRYEDVTHRPSSLNSKTPFATSFQSFSHHDGAMAILKIWKNRLSYRHPATDIIKQTRRGVIRSALLRNLALPEWMLKGSLFGEHGLELDYDRIIVRIANVRHQLSTLLRQEASRQTTSHEPISRAEELNKETRDIDNALEDWKAQIPSDWCYQRHILVDPHPWPRRHFYSSIIYSYASPAYAAFWNHYFATRMLIDSTRLRVLKLSRPNSDNFTHEQQLECFSHMKAMVDNLASSVPFCLQRFKVADTSPNSLFRQYSITLTTNEEIKPYMASLILWPLTLASSLKGVDAKQKLWFKAELAHLGRIVGTGVLECAGADQWLEL
jgi:hypothetical protein